MKKLIILFAIFMILTVSGCIGDNEFITCADDTITCPDGSTVSRVAPDCDFEQCPEVIENGEETNIESDVVYVEILRNEFNPSEITASIGTTIIWTNEDTKTHAVGGAHFGGSSGTLQPGDSWNFTVTQAQVYRFYDTFYYFKGTITVE